LIAERRDGRRSVLRGCHQPRSIGHPSCGGCHISPGKREHVLSHVRDLGVDSAGFAASVSRVQGGHVSRSSLLRGANDIAGEIIIIIIRHFPRKSCALRILKFSDTGSAGGADAIRRDYLLDRRITSYDGRFWLDYPDSCTHDERIHRLR